MEIIYKIIVKLHSIESDIVTPRLSEILSMEDVNQDEFFSYILTIVEKEALSPLTLIFTYSNYPIFVKYFAEPSIKIEDRVTYLDETLRKAMHHQSEFATDIRFIVLYYFCMSGKLVLQKNRLIICWNILI